MLGGVTTYYVGTLYEKKVQGSQQNERKYYFAGANRIAMRENGVLTWLLSDHLGSTSVAVNASGTLVSSLRYTAFGETRSASGTTATDYRYTGQRNEVELGLYYYVARFYDPALGRFVSADSIVPEVGNPVAWDRYAYTLNNPVKYIDPSGNAQICPDGDPCESAFQGPAKEHITPAGDRILDLYTRYNTTPGWWNDYGFTQLTLEKFLGMMILFELSNEYSQGDLLTEVVSRQLWVDDERSMSRSAWCKGNSCVLGVFNWLGVYSQSARNRVDPNSDWEGKPFNKSLNIMDDAKKYGHQALLFSAEYRTYDGNAPLHWGNRRDIWDKSEGRNAGPLVSDIYYRAGSGYFTIYSWNQYLDLGFAK